jgi:hypothetical protein
MKRGHRILLIATFLPLCWLVMMAVHEFGHMLGAWLTGGSVAKVVLYPLVFSRTDLTQNPHPFIVCAAGPLLGSLIPLMVLGIASLSRLREVYLLRFFAAFCMLINGAYIGLGSFEGVGDAGDLLTHGAANWQLWLFGAIACSAAFYFFNGLAARFKEEPNATTAYVSLALLSNMVILEFALSPNG